MKYTLLLPVLLILASCATAAQREAETIKSGTQQTTKELKSCLINVYAMSEYVEVVQHMPSLENDGKPTMAQLANDAFPTRKESDLLISLHDASIPCKQAALTKLQNVLPPIASIFANEMIDSDKLTLQLVKKKITWGKYNQERQELASEYRSKIVRVIRQVENNLTTQHRAELAERDADIQSARAFLAAVGIALQQWGDAAQRNRPIYTSTDCMALGSSISCDSYSR